jgi:hypothetical protein
MDGNAFTLAKLFVCQNMETCSHQEAINRPKHGKDIHTGKLLVHQNREMEFTP